MLDWHHSNLRHGTAGYIFDTVLAPAFGLTLNPQAAAEAEKVLLASLANIESVWIQKKGRLLLGSGQPSIADLSLVRELMELESILGQMKAVSGSWFLRRHSIRNFDM
uniref:GST C-terminal domain-containing protein n=1 Tax=Solanum lycopersicum TaxID=4081 RepID=A0A3Q7G175_SOLLC